MISLPPDLEKAVEQHIASGRYSTPEEVLRAALEQLDSFDLESLSESLEEEQSGHLKPLTEVAGNIREKHGFTDSA